jgi:hypothetical protein
MTARTDLPELGDVLDGADHVDVKTIDSSVTLPEFAAGALNWGPAWVKALFAVRVVFAKLLRLRTAGLPPATDLRPEDVSFTTGHRLSFFTVTRGEENRYLLLEIDDNHLKAYLAFVVEPLHGTSRFRLVTVVHNHRRTGDLYWSVIRPFHHLVVTGMLRAGARPRKAR